MLTENNYTNSLVIMHLITTALLAQLQIQSSNTAVDHTATHTTGNSTIDTIVKHDVTHSGPEVFVTMKFVDDDDDDDDELRTQADAPNPSMRYYWSGVLDIR